MAVVSSPVKVLLDTQALLHGYLGAKLSKRVTALLTGPAVERVLSAASLVEIAIKNGLGKLRMSEQEARDAARDLALTIIPFEPRHGYRLFSLPPHHRDPFDRMIIATALTENIPVISGDGEFRHYRGLKVIW